MAIVKPFAAYRPARDLVNKVAALPYDVMNTKEASELVKDNPYSFLNIDKPEIHVKDSSNDALYKYAASALDKMIEDQILIQDEESFYIYGLRNQYTAQYGLVCCVSADEYNKGIIKKHENTRADKELDRIKHVTYCKAHTGPIFLAYKGIEDFTNWMMTYVKNSPSIYSFKADDDVVHEVYKISDINMIEFIKERFTLLDSLYIADGHHRAAAAVSVANNFDGSSTLNDESKYFLAVAFPKDQLYIMDYNRVLKDESGLTEQELFERLEKIFDIEKIDAPYYKPTKRHNFGMRYNKNWFSLSLKPGIVNEDDVIARLDVSILQQYVLEPLFHIVDPRNDKRIDFVGGIRGIEELNKRTETDMDVAFSMYPTSMDELISVADAKKLMPPKSTWFEPKLRSGLFIHKI